MQSEIEAAVAWWCDVLRRRPHKDNGEEFQSVLGTVASASVKPLSEETIAAFGRDLGTRLPALIEKQGEYFRVLICDYDAQGVLAEAADAAGIKDTMFHFPWKTVMWVNPGEVKVRHGYGSEEQRIYPKGN